MGDGSEGASANDVGAPFKTVKTDSRTVTAFGAPPWIYYHMYNQGYMYIQRS